MKSALVGIKNVLLWSYERGTWQYDLLCLLIILTVFLVPSRYFGDRDRTKPAQANGIHKTASQDAPRVGGNLLANAVVSDLAIESEDLTAFLEDQNRTELTKFPQEAIPLYLRDKLKREVTILDFKSFIAPDGKTGYRVRFR
jgi:hypothetical protein